MLLIVKPAIDIELYKLNKICKALSKKEIPYAIYSESENATFDVFNKTNPNKIIVLDDDLSESIVKAAKQFNTEIIAYTEIPNTADVLLLEFAGKSSLYQCDECCLHLFNSDDVSSLGKRLDNSYEKNFRLYSQFLHSYTCYCGYIQQSSTPTVVASADSVVCLNAVTFADFKLINPNTSMADNSSPADCISNLEFVERFK